jgi:hypothetical protein
MGSVESPGLQAGVPDRSAPARTRHECLDSAHLTSSWFSVLLMEVPPQRRALMIKDIVQLSMAARDQWLAFVSTRRAAAAKLLQARLLLKADVEAGGRRWTEAESADALDTRAATVHRVRQAFVEQGLKAAFSRQRPTGRP